MHRRCCRPASSSVHYTTECDYCAVRTGSLYTVQVTLSLWAVPCLERLLADLPPRRPPFNPRSVKVTFVVDKVTMGQVFLWGLQSFPCQYSADDPHSSSPTCCCHQTDKRSKHGNLPKSNDLSEILEHWIEHCFDLFDVHRARRAL